MEDHASKASSLTNLRVCGTIYSLVAAKKGPSTRRTDMKGVVVSTKAEDDSLLWRGLIVDNKICFAVFGNWLSLRRAGNELGVLVASGLRAKVERR